MNRLVWRIWKVKVLRELRVRGSAVLDAMAYVLLIPPGIPSEALVDDALFYVAELLMARAGRMAKWVTRLSGRKVVLLCHTEGFIPEFSEGFTAIIQYRNAWHLRRLLRAMPRPWLIHGFAPKSHYPDVARRTLPSVPYVHDLQDTLVVYYGTHPTKRWLRDELPHEKACMMHADGVIAHSLEPAEGFRRYAIPRDQRPPTLFFPLYCDDDRFINVVPKISDTEIHLVYAGGVAGSHRDLRYFGNIQFFGLIDMLTKQGLYFHVYPSPTTLEADRVEYERLAKSNARFHFHPPVGQEKLAGELARYHYGLLPFFQERSEQSAEKLRYATTLKLFNYLEAGIGVLVSKDLQYQSWIVRRYNVGSAVSVEDLDRFRDTSQTGSTVALLAEEARRRLSLRTQTGRLLSFYDRITEQQRNAR